MARYVEVPSAALFGVLEKSGFARAQTCGSEVVFECAVDVVEAVGVLRAAQMLRPDGTFKVRVYTSVREGEARARKRGADAIRVTLHWEAKGPGPGYYGPQERGLYSQRVFRAGTVEGVLERTLGRMREAYKLGATMRRCPDCAGPAWPDSGRCVRRCGD